MGVNWNFISAFVFSLFLHTLLVAVLVFSMDSGSRQVIKPPPQVNIVEAVTVDEKQVEKELKRLRDIDNEKLAREKKQQQELERKLKDLQDKAANVQKTRKAEEQKLADLKKQKAAEQKVREQEELKLAQVKKEQEDLEKKKKQEEELKKQREAEQKQQEEERKRKEEAEQQRKAEEQRLQAELAAEQKQREAAQQSRDQKLLQGIIMNIKRRVVDNFNKSGLPEGLECVLSVRLVPGGEVISVTISESSGNDIFDRRALVAMQKASPLPGVPTELATFERLNLRQLRFRFKP